MATSLAEPPVSTGGTPAGGWIGGAPAAAPVHPIDAFGVPLPLARTSYAGFWRRFWGLFLDRMALWILLLPVGMVMGFDMMSILGDGEWTADKLTSLVFGSLSIWLVRSFAEWVYFSAFHASPRQATPGQMLLGIRVVGPDGGRIGFGRATGRYLASWLSGVLLGFGFLMALFTERRQTLHDMIAGTLVVRDRVHA